MIHIFIPACSITFKVNPMTIWHYKIFSLRTTIGEDVIQVVHNHVDYNKSTSNLFPLDNPSQEDMSIATQHPQTKFLIYNQVNLKNQYYNEKGVYKESALSFFH